MDTVSPIDDSSNGTYTENPPTVDKLIIIGTGCGGGALLLIVVFVVVIVCLRRRRRKERKGAPPMPPLEELPFEPEPQNRYQRRNSDSDINNVRLEIYNSDDDDDDDDDKDYENTGSPDYENNPVSVARAKEEADLRLAQRRNGPSPFLAHSPVLNPTPGGQHPTPPFRNAHTLKPEAAVAAAGGTPPGAAAKSPKSLPGNPPGAKCLNRNHVPSKTLAYINTSRSLEELDKRTVPLPPPMPSGSGLDKKKPPGPAPPPKSHKGQVKGYVNQPL